MNFLKTLFGNGETPRHDDPTAGWAPSTPDLPLPELDLVNRRLGALEFDKSDIHAASFLGRPQGFKFKEGQDIELAYPERGMTVSIEEGTLAEVDFAISPIGVPALDAKVTGYASPVLWIGGGRSLRLTAETSLAEIQALLGPPLKIDEDEDEIDLSYELHGLHLDFEIQLPARNLNRLYVWSIGVDEED